MFFYSFDFTNIVIMRITVLVQSIISTLIAEREECYNLYGDRKAGDYKPLKPALSLRLHRFI
ncbi:MAG: hypothetical protein CG439_1339 [Methylococcaceae bacterium NSP1-2]|nr:MAG: hypothetical protein CG439_1339 [Methylococcaceae bacterium NSP1-2]